MFSGYMASHLLLLYGSFLKLRNKVFNFQTQSVFAYIDRVDFLKIIKPLFQKRVHVGKLFFDGNLQPEVIQMCSDILEGQNVASMGVFQDHDPEREY